MASCTTGIDLLLIQMVWSLQYSQAKGSRNVRNMVQLGASSFHLNTEIRTSSGIVQNRLANGPTVGAALRVKQVNWHLLCFSLLSLQGIFYLYLGVNCEDLVVSLSKLVSTSVPLEVTFDMSCAVKRERNSVCRGYWYLKNSCCIVGAGEAVERKKWAFQSRNL